MLRGWAVLLIAASMLTETAAFGLGKATFGAEFTFFDPVRGGNDGYEKVVDRMHRHLIDFQQGPAKFWRDGFHFYSPNGWGYSIGTDPGVIEVRTDPATIEDFKRYQADMQDAIFVSAANEGFFPALFQGGGHLNLGTDTFSGNDLLLRNFIVDLINHNELFLGIFNYDYENARSFSLLDEKVQKEVYELIDYYDKGAYGAGAIAQTDFLKDLHKAMGNGLGKRYAFALDDVGMHPTSRIEIRAVRPQASMDVWVRQIDLIYHRLLYLEKIKEPIRPLWRVAVEQVRVKEPFRNDLNPPVNPQQALRAFYQYVSESGLKWQDHRDYLWPKWVANGELLKFESSAWFHKREAKTSACELALAG